MPQKPPVGTRINRSDPIGRSVVGCWLFNEGAGNRAIDVSGKGNHGTLNGGPTWTTGDRGRALNFDGVDDVVVCPGGFLTSVRAFTLVLRLNLTAFVSGRVIFAKGTSNSSRVGCQFSGATGGVNLFLSDGSANTFATLPNNSLVLGWHEYVIRFDGYGATNSDRLKVFRDGSELSIASFTGVIPSATSGDGSSFYIGNYFTGAFQTAMQMDGVLAVNRALTPSEILRLYKDSDCYLVRPLSSRVHFNAPLDYYSSAAFDHFDYYYSPVPLIEGKETTGNFSNFEFDVDSGFIVPDAYIEPAGSSVDVTASVTGAGTVSGSLGVIIQLSGSASGQSTASGTLDSGLQGSANGAATVSAAADAIRGLSGSLSGAAAVSSDVSITRGFSGLPSGAAVVSGTIIPIRGLYGSASGQASVTGDANIGGQMSGSVAAQASVSSTGLDIFRGLSGSASGQASSTAMLGAIQQLSSSVSGQADVSGGLTVLIPVSGSAPGAATVSATHLAAIVPLSGSAAGQATATANLAIDGVWEVFVYGQGNVAANLKITRGFSASVSGQAQAASALTVCHSVSGGSAGQSTAAGQLTRVSMLTTSISGQSQISGTLVSIQQFSQAISGQASASGALLATRGVAGTTSSSAQVSGALTVIIPVSGTSSGQAAVTGLIGPYRTLSGLSFGNSLVAGVFRRFAGLSGTANGQSVVLGGVTGTFHFGAGEISAIASVSGNLAIQITPGLITFDQIDALLQRGSWEISFYDPAQPGIDEVIFAGDGLDDIDIMIRRLLAHPRARVKISVDHDKFLNIQKFVPCSPKDIYNLRQRLVEKFGETDRITYLHLSGELFG